MITGEIKSQIDAIWNAFWTGGISNPLEVIEQLTYLLFIKRLDELHTAQEKKANQLGRPMEKAVFGDAAADQSCRWSRFKHLPPAEMYDAVQNRAFPFIKALGGDGTAYARHMRDAIFKIPTPALLARVVDMIDKVPMQDRDTKGDVYEYMLGKLATAGQNGQFRTPRHIIKLMVELTAPKPTDTVCDPACGTAGFLVAAGEYLREHHPEILTDPALRERFAGTARPQAAKEPAGAKRPTVAKGAAKAADGADALFQPPTADASEVLATLAGYDFDGTMLRIGSMNLIMHGVEDPHVTYRDALAKDHADEEERFTLILANPSFKGSLDHANASPKLLQTVRPSCCSWR